MAVMSLTNMLSGQSSAASGISTWSISRIIERIGERVPSADESKKSFRMATIVIESNEFPLTPDDVKLLNAQLDLFNPT